MFSIGHILEYNAFHFGPRTAIISGKIHFTYEQFNKRVDHLAWGLSSLGLTKGDICSIMLYNSNEFLESYFAASKIGAITNPLNYRLNENEIQFILSHAKPKVFITTKDFYEHFSSHFLESLKDTPIILVSDADEALSPALNYEMIITQFEGKKFKTNAFINDDNMLVYTSGTTGFPKGAIITNKHIIWNSFSTFLFFSLNANDVTLAAAPLFHVAGLHDFVFPHIHIGGTVFLQPKFNPDETLKIIKHNNITNIFLVPTMYQMLLDNLSFGTSDVSPSLRMVSSGAAPLSSTLCNEIRSRIHKNLFYGYGLTEAGPNICFCEYPKFSSKLNSIGVPLPNNFVILLDENQSEIKSPGKIGEIAISGEVVFKGYLNDRNATMNAKIKLPHDLHQRDWVITGDLAYKDEEGFFYIADRKKDMIISGGENIYCIEVENVLDSYPDVKESAVIGIPDEKWGEIVKAFIVPYKGKAISMEQLNKYCRSRFAPYKVPKLYQVIDSIPRNASGKILRRNLRDPVTLEKE